MTDADKFMSEIPDQCKTVLLTDSDLRDAKTAHGLLRYPFKLDPVAIVDRSGYSTLAEALPWYEGKDIPVVPNLREAMREQPDLAVVGVAPPGGFLTQELRIDVLGALESGLHVASGLHDFLGDDKELRAASKERGGQIYDLRKPPKNFRVTGPNGNKSTLPVILTCGTDCALGKRTTAVEMWQAARNVGVKAAFFATGQTGIMLGPDAGLVVDRIPGDFISGEVDGKISELCQKDFQAIIVEGQGALYHPAYGAVSLGLLLGSAPTGVVMVHDPQRTNFLHFDIPIAGLAAETKAIRDLGHTKIIAYSTRGIESCKSLEKEGFGPAFDPLLPGHSKSLWKEVSKVL